MGDGERFLDEEAGEQLKGDALRCGGGGDRSLAGQRGVDGEVQADVEQQREAHPEGRTE